VHPADPANSRISADDVREYAKRRGWWSPEDGPFDFSGAYRSRGPDGEVLEPRRFDLRQWRGLSLLGGRPVSEADAQAGGLPFCVRPVRPVGVRDVMALLRDHLEGTRFEDRMRPHPHGGERKICWSTTILSVVARLDPGAPAPLAARLWTAFGRPDAAPYVPWHPSLLAVPEGYCRVPGVSDPDSALARHFDSPDGTFDRHPGSAFWAFKDLASALDDSAFGRRPVVAAALAEFEDRAQSGQDAFERGLANLPEPRAREALTRRTAALAADAASLARRLLSESHSGAPAPRPAGSEDDAPCGSTESTSG
jgi:dipeptidase